MKILAVASGGGHWIELLRLRPAFEPHSVHYITVKQEYCRDVPESGFDVVRDATQWQPLRALALAAQICLLVAKIRPDVVISTGAAPGYFALRFGKLFRARTVWVDSLANVDAMSKAGEMSRYYADLWLTQWPDLASEDGPAYCGKVI